MGGNMIKNKIVIMTDEEQYYKNLLFNTQYVIRDIFTLEQLYELRRFITNCIEEVEGEV
jgi:hypothetical protein